MVNWDHPGRSDAHLHPLAPVGERSGPGTWSGPEVRVLTGRFVYAKIISAALRARSKKHSTFCLQKNPAGLGTMPFVFFIGWAAAVENWGWKDVSGPDWCWTPAGLPDVDHWDKALTSLSSEILPGPLKSLWMLICMYHWNWLEKDDQASHFSELYVFTSWSTLHYDTAQ